MGNNVKNTKKLASPNRIIWEYFDCLRNMIRDIQGSDEQKNLPRKVLPCVFTAVAITEAFLNIYFRILAEETSCSSCREQTIKELDENISLDRKIRTWPKRFFDKGIDFSQGIGQRFMNFKKLRNNLMHFRSSYDTVKTFDGEIRGLVDLACYETLDQNIAWEAIDIAEGVITEIFKLKGANDDQIGHYLHQWTGKVPSVAKS